ncbi:hypothetical protein AB4090_13040 [Acidithiobacillus sp. IBUN Pt1247-S3]|uniref:hypothetical protein n=1 Tax=Acidithiobacillus sp. IBUN Pt1247-S3 TaxID=3166642 RepID=UPI0034E53868
MRRTVMVFSVAWIALGAMAPAQAAVHSIDELPYVNVVGCNDKEHWAAQRVICSPEARHSKLWDKLVQEDGYVFGQYRDLLQNTALNSPEQQRIVVSQGEYLRRRDACGKDLLCMLRVEEARDKELMALRAKLRKDLPEDEIAAWSKGWVIPGSGGKPQALGQRVMAGFALYPLPHVTLADGSTLFWGFQQGEGSVQSLAMTNGKGQLQVLGMADDLLLSSKEKTSTPQLRLFVQDPKALERYLPALRAWAAADSLGFNQECPGKDAQRCTAAMQSPLPIRAFLLRHEAGKKRENNALQSPVPLPKVQDSVSPGLFWQ